MKTIKFGGNVLGQNVKKHKRLFLCQS